RGGRGGRGGRDGRGGRGGQGGQGGEFSFVIGNWTGQFDELITSDLYNLSFYLIQIKMMKLTLIQRWQSFPKIHTLRKYVVPDCLRHSPIHSGKETSHRVQSLGLFRQ
ncbi:unnamed protein product, partial [Porites evermanni]